MQVLCNVGNAARSFAVPHLRTTIQSHSLDEMVYNTQYTMLICHFQPTNAELITFIDAITQSI